MESDGFQLVKGGRKVKKVSGVRSSVYVDIFNDVSVEEIETLMQHAFKKMENSRFRYLSLVFLYINILAFQAFCYSF